MSVTIQPIFVKDNNEYSFKGCIPGLPKRSNMDFRFIVDTLREHFGDDLDFTEKDGMFIIPFDVQIIEEIKNIYQKSSDYLINMEESHLKFKIISIDNVGLTKYEY
jgi:hypothetical protein